MDTINQDRVNKAKINLFYQRSISVLSNVIDEEDEFCYIFSSI